MACVGSIRIEKDIYAAELLMRKKVTSTNYAPDDQKYAQILAEFAFEMYFEETKDFAQVAFYDIDARIAIVGMTNGQRILTTANICDCTFHYYYHYYLFDPLTIYTISLLVC